MLLRIGSVAAVALMMSMPVAMAQDALVPVPTLTLSGHGEAFVSPDQAVVTSGVVTSAPTARDALAANTRDMASLVDLIRSFGVEDRDIQTSGFSVSPEYVYSNEPNSNGYQKPPKIVSYRVSNNVTVRVRDLEDLGAILDGMVAEGANAIDGVQFSVGETGKLLDEARRKAFADAKRKADIYAASAGIELGRILTMSEGGGYQPPQPYMMKETMAMDAMAGAAPVPVQAGELTFSIDVNVQWELLQD